MVSASLVLDSELHSEDNFCIFCYHAEESSYPHPENCTGTAGENSACHTGNIPGAHGARQGCRHSLKRRDVGAVILLGRTLEQRPDSVFQYSAEMCHLQPVNAAGQVNTCTHQQQQHQRAPCKVVNSPVNGFHF